MTKLTMFLLAAVAAATVAIGALAAAPPASAATPRQGGAVPSGCIVLYRTTGGVPVILCLGR